MTRVAIPVHLRAHRTQLMGRRAPWARQVRLSRQATGCPDRRWEPEQDGRARNRRPALTAGRPRIVRPTTLEVATRAMQEYCGGPSDRRLLRSSIPTRAELRQM